MATSRINKRPSIFQDENSGMPPKKPIISGKTNGSETATKTGGVGLGGRKALNDITNKSSTNQEASSKKKNTPKQEFNEAEEAFLHDHKECIMAQQAMMNKFDVEGLVLPGHGIKKCTDSINAGERPQSEEGESDSESFDLRELDDSESSDGMELSTQGNSPPWSPTSSGQPTTVECEFGDQVFVLAPLENGELEEEQDH